MVVYLREKQQQKRRRCVRVALSLEQRQTWRRRKREVCRRTGGQRGKRRLKEDEELGIYMPTPGRLSEWIVPGSDAPC